MKATPPTVKAMGIAIGADISRPMTSAKLASPLNRTPAPTPAEPSTTLVIGLCE